MAYLSPIWVYYQLRYLTGVRLRAAPPSPCPRRHRGARLSARPGACTRAPPQVPILEKAADKRWGNQAAYQAYKRRVPVFWPRLP